MNSAQRLIKYFAIAFAFFLIFNIFSGIMYGIMTLSNIFDNDYSVVDNSKNLNISKNSSVIDIKLTFSNLIIKEGKYFKAETNNKYIKIKQNSNELFIEEKNNNWFKNKDNNLIIYIPKDLNFDSINIEQGCGKIEIQTLYTNKLKLNLGAGKTTINELNVYNQTEIKGGAGKLSIGSGKLNNLKLDMGIGKVSLKAALIGKNNIEAGIGEITLSLIGDNDIYKVIADKGIGTIKFNGENIKEEVYYGTGVNEIDIDGGIGNIYISTK